MKKTISITFEIEDSNNLKQDLYATIYYPDEGNKIILRKGMNVIELSETIHHEIGHLIDWYLSKGNSRDHVDVREDNAVTIGEGIRFKGELN